MRADRVDDSTLTSRNRGRCSTPLQTIHRIRYNQDLYRQALRTSRQFVGLHEVCQASTTRYSGEEYLKLLQTFSDHRAISEPNKSRFFEAISQVITQMGGEVTRHYETLVLLAKKG